MHENLILKTDAYKQTHWKLYPPGTEVVCSYLESRGGEAPGTMFFGLQALLKRHFLDPVTLADVAEAEQVCREVFGADYFNRPGWEHIVREHGGRIPVRIMAVPEGLVVPVGNVLLTVENTDERVPFITNFIETLLVQVWYPITVATLSWRIKVLLTTWAEKTGGTVGPFHVHDFGYRGVSSQESAGIGGAAHLINFRGTDTLAALGHIRQYYREEHAAGNSVMAAEHSTVTMYGPAGEREAYARFLEQCPGGVLSVVSDSYDLYHAIEVLYNRELKARILARGGKLVVRPDSGHPPSMAVECLELLWKGFGGTINAAGYRVLHPKVGVIYGDWISYEMIEAICRAMAEAGFATCPENLVFGMGGRLLQRVHRDTHQFAFKCCAGKINGVWREVYKSPATDAGKNSKGGRLKLVRVGAGGRAAPPWVLVEGHKMLAVRTVKAETEAGADLLEPVFLNGRLRRDEALSAVRARAEQFV